MVKDPFRAWLTQHIWPVLKPMGYTRRGRMFLRALPNGTETGVAFFRMGNFGGTHLPIEIRVSAGTHTSRAWSTRPSPAPPPGIFEPCLWEWSPTPPADRAFSIFEHLWNIDPTDPDSDTGPYVAHQLLTEWLPVADTLTDLPTFEAELRKPTWELPGKVIDPHYTGKAIVIAAQRDDPEIDELAATAIQLSPHHDAGYWIRDTMPRGPWPGNHAHTD